MERVVTINLNGNPYQLEEPAHDALRAYLARAEAALADNPDKAEIIRDLEQAIADKCAGHLSPHKSVVSAADMKQVLDEMGPVEGGGASDGARTASEPPRRRLYRIRDRSVIAGVCSGIGAYFDIDANIVRLLFILAALFTSGFAILVYIVLIFAVPSAHTSAEWAAAHGAPFNAQEVIERARREYDRFADESARTWRREHRAWRRAWRERERAFNSLDWGWTPAPPPAAPDKPVGYLTRMFAGLFAFVFSVVTAALLIAFLIALFSLLNTGAVFGWTPPGDIPNWLAIVVLCIAYAAISSPFSAMRRSSYATLSGHRAHGGADGLLTLVLAALALWLAYLYWPEARDMIEQVPDTLRNIGVSLREL
jgi:phage shock protein PspC (stress-responsive transcriptional regulator)